MTDATAGGAPRAMAHLPGMLRTAGHWAVALTSLGLVAGLVAWGHDTMTREIEGVPVIHAVAGKMRIAPQDAGGSSVRYQELTVGRIAAGAGVEAPPARVRVAATGTDLSPEDFVQPASADAPVVEAEVDPATAQQEATNIALTGVMMMGQVIPGDVPGVAKSPRPFARPALITGAARVLANVSAAPVGKELDPAAIADGTPLAQLGAFPDAQSARSAWSVLAARHETLLADRDHLVIEVPVAGRVLWRLRVAGFENREDAVRFCSALFTAGSECIPTVHG